MQATRDIPAFQDFCGSRSPISEHVGLRTFKSTLVLHKASSSGAYRAVYKALHGIFTGLSLVILSEIQKK